jgi:HEXXH motif-containing protein
LTGIDNPTEECWSALGDFCFRREEHRPARAYYEAPCVGGMIPVDYFSPYARFVDTMSNCAFEQYTDVERQDLFVKFEQAFESMMLASACASRFVAKLVRVVIPRKSSLRGDRCGSSSSRLHIGRVIFPNGHIMDGEGLADGLIHEAIHGALNTLEALGYVENPSSASLRFRSPWSGNDLSVRTYLHACFVWYGLVYFWHFAMCRDTSPSTRVCELASRAIKGFRHGNPIDPLLPHAGPISRVWLEVAGSLHSELRDNGLLN